MIDKLLMKPANINIYSSTVERCSCIRMVLFYPFKKRIDNYMSIG